MTLHGNAPHVLVVDDDRAAAQRCADVLDDLNYRHDSAASAREALERVIRDPDIGIVLAAVEMPSLDGFVLVEELRARLDDDRPFAAILMCEEIDAALALRAMHVGAADLLQKPVAPDAYSAALRRAMKQIDGRRASRMSDDLAVLTERIARLSDTLGKASPEDRRPEAIADKDIAATLRQIISSRSLRARYFPNQLFADPAWDILLDLTRARLDNQQVSVSSVCIAASVPMSTALRWVKQMTEAGLLKRWTDPKDRRRDLIALTDQTAERMREYLVQALAGMRNI